MWRITITVTLSLLTIPTINVVGQESIYLLGEPNLRLGGDTQSPLALPIDYSFGDGDTIYVLDSIALQVVAFSLGGEELFSFGKEGAGPGEFVDVSSICYSDGFVYVADSQLNRISKYSNTGDYIQTIGVRHRPFDIEIYEGSIIVAPRSSSVILWKISIDQPRDQDALVLFNQFPDLVADSAGGSRSDSNYLCIDNNQIYLTMPRFNRILRVDLQSNNVLNSTLITPSSTLIDAYWEYYHRELALQNTKDRTIVPLPFSTIALWEDNLIVLSINTKGINYSGTMSILVDVLTGADAGIHIAAENDIVSRLSKHDNTLVCIDWDDSTINIYDMSRLSAIRH